MLNILTPKLCTCNAKPTSTYPKPNEAKVEGRDARNTTGIPNNSEKVFVVDCMAVESKIKHCQCMPILD